MKRRAFLAGLLAAPPVAYFFMGPSWEKHGALYYHAHPVFDYGTHDIMQIEKILKKYYNDKVVANLRYSGDPFKGLVPFRRAGKSNQLLNSLTHMRSRHYP
jgi:hypothetical protein